MRTVITQIYIIKVVTLITKNDKPPIITGHVSGYKIFGNSNFLSDSIIYEIIPFDLTDAYFKQKSSTFLPPLLSTKQMYKSYPSK